MLVASSPALAGGKDVLTAFTGCDAKFFRVLKANADLFADAPMQAGADMAYLTVPDRTAAGKQDTRFKSPVKIEGLSVVGYSDEFTRTDKMTNVLWGFFIAEEPAVVAKALNDMSKGAAKLQAGTTGFVRDEVYSGGRWHLVKASNSPLGLERVLQAAPSDAKDFPGTRLTCSIQDAAGAATKTEIDKVLKALRPDI